MTAWVQTPLHGIFGWGQRVVLAEGLQALDEQLLDEAVV